MKLLQKPSGNRVDKAMKSLESEAEAARFELG
ncbi:hypothetical protein EV641_12737 [Rhodococcus sp. SMB37]|nr:hypothetical protein EV641_12737 [Rhodococcus sp. SMB37]